MGVTLDDKTRSWLDAQNLPVIATVNDDGSPHSSIILVKRDEDDQLYFVTHVGRRTERNISRDPRVNLSLYPRDDPYTSVEIRGVAEVLDIDGNKLADELTLKYLDELHDVDDNTRVAIRFTPQKVIHFPDPKNPPPRPRPQQ
ncbi:TIGR03618 family F420-dependent PPOX class oxidoreductase [Frankia sp. Mgl5]|uniref:TIGR03618 family F420-dependent PPOX class oxidoreductase n=1 Tax=Frankiaceae TaxID=74712 RepID=UPI000054352F|nr:TIGR03618 family F420-dependent PPOX class oxidoreductase [Frankia sp. Mgl5]ABW14195.1 pyridoxamine 5'-phosphate oxidase-related FMN-binding [Frankia sp. EAN1pec]MCK9931132.1 TIGR03618 family F420-dependent PPOX class oxidoreductase [Frankia sp. Mgl5]